MARFESTGVKLIAIGISEPKKPASLPKGYSFPLPFPLYSLYADPERKAYNLLGLYYGIGRTFFNPASAKVLSKSRFEALKKAVKNYTIEATPDDRGSVLEQDEGTGDHAPLDDIFNLCCKVPVA